MTDTLAALLHSQVCQYHDPELLTCGVDHVGDAARLAARGVIVAEPSCCDLACYEDEGCACDGCRPKEPQAALLAAARAVLAATAMELHRWHVQHRTDRITFGDCQSPYCVEARAAIEEADRG